MSELNTCFNSKAFCRYPKIDNLQCTNDFPSDLDADHYTFYASEKVDGANLGMYLPIAGDNAGIPSFYSRSGENAEAGLFKFGTDKNKLAEFVADLTEFCQHSLHSNVAAVYLWGEYFGSNINRRIKYDADGDVVFFNMMIIEDGNNTNKVDFVTCDKFNEFVDYFNKSYTSGKFIKAYKLNTVRTITEVMDQLKLPATSRFGDDNIEGYVITGVDNDTGRIVQFKLKDEKFSERKSKGPKSQSVKIDSGLDALHNQFIEYVNINRAVGLLSKTTERRNIGKLIGLLIRDAREDFIKDNSEQVTKYDDKQLKYVFNVGNRGLIAITNALKQIGG